MNNKNVAHVWAHQTTPNGNGSHFFFEGSTLYSYGKHFPVGTFITVGREKERVCLLTCKIYSRTTARHKSYARQAVSHLSPIFVWDMPSDATMSRKKYTAYVAREARKIKLAEAGKHVDGLERARLARAAMRKVKKAEDEFPQLLIKWRARELESLPYVEKFSRGKFLRLSKDGSRIETSGGAQILTRFAPIVWALVVDCMNCRGRFTEVSHVSFPDFSFENYTGLTVCRDGSGPTPQGAICVGCHQISFSELIPMAEALGLPMGEIPERKAQS